MDDGHQLILDRDTALAAVSAAVAAAAAGHGSVILLDGPAGIGKSAVLRAAAAEAAAGGLRTLSARGLSLEQGFTYGIVRQLFEPARAAAPGEWETLLDGEARLARRVFGEPEPSRPGRICRRICRCTCRRAAARPTACRTRPCTACTGSPLTWQGVSRWH